MSRESLANNSIGATGITSSTATTDIPTPTVTYSKFAALLVGGGSSGRCSFTVDILWNDYIITIAVTGPWSENVRSEIR
ncbi:MAG: hypothetical protein ABJZ55_05740 [Fuerstiella sp.]